jgi:hypothetical protein
MRAFRSPDGLTWGVVVQLPSHSGGQLVFRHPDGHTSGGDRYAWINAPAGATSDPRERLSAQTLLDSLGDEEIARLFRRSMPVTNRLQKMGRRQPA